MDRADFALVISIILASIRVYEFFCSLKPGISITTLLTSLPDIGNYIVILNSSTRPYNIYYFDLAYVKRTWVSRYCKIFRKVESEDSPLDIHFCDFTIPPHGQYKLNFSEGDHFTWGSSQKHDIYLRLWLVGRKKPAWFFIPASS